MTRRARTVRLSVPMLCLVALFALGSASKAHASSSDIVLYASDAASARGHWSSASSSGAAGGRAMVSTDQGWSSTSAPMASPSHYFEMTFQAPANTPYRVWLRLRAKNNSKWNDAVWVQFSDSLVNGSAAYRVGTTSALLVNLERCSGCGTSGWGWQNTGYWLQQQTAVSFASSGTHTLRVQTREDGVEIDQVVLSPQTFYSSAPGEVVNDTTIVPKSASGSTPYSGTPVSLPGTVNARDFDKGGQNVAYYDSTSGNAGTAYRAEDVDLQASAEGGHNVGWTTPGEWLKYSVNVATAGTYTVRLKVASPNTGAQVNVAFDKSGVNQTVTAPNTGGWQVWKAVEFQTSLSAGTQALKLTFPQGGVNVLNVVVAAVSSSSPSSSPASGPYSGTPAALPGTVEAAQFDTGSNGTAYYDTTSGNSGGAYRSTDVDIQGASIGGYNVGWTAAGEWLKYTVNVTAPGSYTLQMKVAAPSAQSLQVSFGAPSSATASVSVPSTGDWQKWTTVSVPITLASGTQAMTVKFTNGGVNLRSITVASVQAPPPPPPSSGSGGSFRMMTWNIQHGRRKDGGYDPAGQAKFIASQNPHVVVLQEVQTWDENQPAKYKSLLEQYTGVSWYLQWAPVNGRTGTEGNVVLTRLPVTSSTYHQMHATSDHDAMYSNRSVAQATVLVGGVPVHVFSTHLDYANTSYRTAQLLDMMDWTQKFGPRRIVGGDFNSWWGEYWIITMKGDYYDSWEQYTGSNQNGHTVNGAVRFDYLFWSKEGGDKVKPTKVFVPATTLSDHYPVIADYTVTP